MKLRLEASPSSPVRNLAIVVEGWGEAGAPLALDGRPVPRGAGFRFGHRRTLESTDLVGTGAVRLDEANRVMRVGGVRWTIKDGIAYDARKLLADVRRMVRAAKDEEGFEIRPPGR